MQPVAQPPRRGGRARPLRPLQVWAEIVCLGEGDLPERAAVNPPHQLDKRRRHADLKTDVQAEPPLRLRANLNHAQGPKNVNRHRLLAINMFAGLDGCRQVLRVIIRRRGDQHRIDLPGGNDALIGLRPREQLRGVHARVAALLRQIVEMLPGGRNLIFEHIGQGGHPGAAADRHSLGINPAPAAAPKQPDPHRRVRRRTPHRFRSEDHDAAGAAEKSPPPNPIVPVHPRAHLLERVPQRIIEEEWGQLRSGGMERKATVRADVPAFPSLSGGSFRKRAPAQPCRGRARRP